MGKPADGTLTSSVQGLKRYGVGHNEVVQGPTYVRLTDVLGLVEHLDPPESVQVLAIDSEVLVEGRSGKITAIQILRGGNIKYECVWWDADGRHEEALEAWEVKSDGDKARGLRVNQVL